MNPDKRSQIEKLEKFQSFFLVQLRCAPGMDASCYYIWRRNGKIIGHNLRVRPGAGLISANNDLNDYDRWPEVPPIRIGDNVWTGMNSIVLPGTTIGDNIILASNSVVMKDIPSNSTPDGKLYKVVREKDPYQGKDYSEL